MQCLTSIHQRVERLAGGCLLPINEAVVNRRMGCLVSFRENVQKQTSGCLIKINEKVINKTKSKKWHFSGDYYGFKHFDLSLFINGFEENVCQLIDNIEISRAENENTILKLSLSKNCGKIDFYQYFSKSILLKIITENNQFLLFKGFINDCNYDIFARKVVITATDEKINNINKLTQSQLNKIGYYSKMLFENDTKEEEFNHRMESIPYSFFYDVNGNFQLTEWKPKNQADFIINECSISRDIVVNTLKLGRVVNSFDIDFNFVYYRKIQRDLKMTYTSGYKLCYTPDCRNYGVVSYGVCDYMKSNFVLAPPLSAVQQAVFNSGWAVGNFIYEPIANSQHISCSGRTYGWIVSNNQDYVQSARWIASKRWVQEINRIYKINLKNQASINLLGEKKDSTQFSIKIELSDDDNWTQYNCYRQPPQGFYVAENGDFIQDAGLTMQADFNQAFQYIANYAKTRIYQSHRENQLNFSMQFMPQLALNHTIVLNGKIYKGNSKVSRITHSIDINTRIAQTSIESKFYKGFAGDSNIAIPQISRTPVSGYINNETNFFIKWKYQNSNSNTGFTISSTNVLGEHSDYCETQTGDDGLYGFVLLNYSTGGVYIQGTYYQNKGVIGLPYDGIERVKFAIKTPDVEKESTDKKETTQTINYNIAIPNTYSEVYYYC